MQQFFLNFGAILKAKNKDCQAELSKHVCVLGALKFDLRALKFDLRALKFDLRGLLRIKYQGRVCSNLQFFLNFGSILKAKTKVVKQRGWFWGDINFN